MSADPVPESFSQFGEDLLVWRHFGGRRPGFYIEAGASQPFHQSQSWFFEQRGWGGILVEPIGAKAARLRELRPGSRVFECALGSPTQRGRATFFVVPDDDNLSGLAAPDDHRTQKVEVAVRTLDEVLEECGRPAIDFFSLDVEGNELEVLAGFTLGRHRPRLMLIEDHLQSLQVHRHMVANGYRLVKRTGCNNWYVPAREPFHLSSAAERFALWKEIHLDTPVRIVRFALKRWRRRRARGSSPA
jgi:FkbM family methyltransferase